MNTQRTGRAVRVAVLAGLAVGGLSACTSAERSASRGGPQSPAWYAPAAGPEMNVVARALPTGDPATSVLLVHDVRPERAGVERPFTSEIHVTNISASTLRNVVIVAEDPDNLTFSESRPPGEPDGEGNTRWALGALEPGHTKIIAITGAAPAPGPSTARLSAAWATAPFVAATTHAVLPLLSVTKSAPARASACDPIPLTYEVRNTGTDACEGVVITDVLPPGLTVGGQTVVSVIVGTLEPGRSAVLTFDAAAAGPGVYSSAATAGGTGASAVSEPASTLVAKPALAVETRGPGAGLVNRPVAYTITVRNTGDADACDTLVTLPVPDAAEVASFDAGGEFRGGSIVWNLGLLPAGESRAVSFSARPLSPGRLAFNAAATARCADPGQAVLASLVAEVPRLGTVVIDSGRAVRTGRPHTYRVEVENGGPVPLSNVRTVVSLPEGLEYVASAEGVFAGGRVELHFGTLRPGERRQATFTVRAMRSGEYVVVGETMCSEVHAAIREDERADLGSP